MLLSEPFLFLKKKIKQFHLCTFTGCSNDKQAAFLIKDEDCRAL